MYLYKNICIYCTPFFFSNISLLAKINEVSSPIGCRNVHTYTFSVINERPGRGRPLLQYTCICHKYMSSGLNVFTMFLI